MRCAFVLSNFQHPDFFFSKKNEKRLKGEGGKYFGMHPSGRPGNGRPDGHSHKKNPTT